jgi:hypothetical protein
MLQRGAPHGKNPESTGKCPPIQARILHDSSTTSYCSSPSTTS